MQTADDSQGLNQHVDSRSDVCISFAAQTLPTCIDYQFTKLRKLITQDLVSQLERYNFSA